LIDDILSELPVSEKRLRRRTPVRLKQIRNEIQEISERIDVKLDLSGSFLERGHFQERDLILVDKIPLAMQIQTDSGNYGIRLLEEFYLGALKRIRLP
jgi:hypothetical protein